MTKATGKRKVSSEVDSATIANQKRIRLDSSVKDGCERHNKSVVSQSSQHNRRQRTLASNVPTLDGQFDTELSQLMGGFEEAVREAIVSAFKEGVEQGKKESQSHFVFAANHQLTDVIPAGQI